jgi:hypothetical protein
MGPAKRRADTYLRLEGWPLPLDLWVELLLEGVDVAEEYEDCL